MRGYRGQHGQHGPYPRHHENGPQLLPPAWCIPPYLMDVRLVRAEADLWYIHLAEHIPAAAGNGY
jgi:hypothetical protein